MGQRRHHYVSPLPEAYFKYVEQLDATRSGVEGAGVDSNAAIAARKAAAVTAFAELGQDFRPKPVKRDLLHRALTERASGRASPTDLPGSRA
jgi:hypothetical protein